MRRRTARSVEESTADRSESNASGTVRNVIRRHAIFVLAYLGLVALVVSALSAWHCPGKIHGVIPVNYVSFTIPDGTEPVLLDDMSVSLVEFTNFAPVQLPLAPESIISVGVVDRYVRMSQGRRSITVSRGVTSPTSSFRLDDFTTPAFITGIRVSPKSDVAISIGDPSDTVHAMSGMIQISGKPVKVRIEPRGRFHATSCGCSVQGLSRHTDNESHELVLSTELREGADSIVVAGEQGSALRIDIRKKWAGSEVLLGSGIGVDSIEFRKTIGKLEKSTLRAKAEIGFTRCPDKAKIAFGVGECVEFVDRDWLRLNTISIDQSRRLLEVEVTGSVHHIRTWPEGKKKLAEDHYLTAFDLVCSSLVLRVTFGSLGILPMLLGIWRWITRGE